MPRGKGMEEMPKEVILEMPFLFAKQFPPVRGGTNFQVFWPMAKV